MAATDEMKKMALEVRPDVVSLVPERWEELTTEGGLNVVAGRAHLSGFIPALRQDGIKVSIFVDPDVKQIESCHKVGVPLIEINTGKYAEQKPGEEQTRALQTVREAAAFGHRLGLEIHAGHGLDYRNVQSIVAIPEISELSIGFAIVARAAVVGVVQAVKEMIAAIGKR
jgi:pyridoxine 5-phosphate synthase